MEDGNASVSTIETEEKKHPTIVIHQLPRSKYTPNLSPFPIKLETYLRIAGIPFTNDFDNPMSKKSKTPWMTVDGVDVADSYFCIDYLRKNYDIDINKHLSEQDKAVAVSFRTLIEDHLYWTLVYWRLNKENYSVLKTHMQSSFLFGNIVLPILRRKIGQQLYAQGMGRHSMDEICQFIHEDLHSLSTFLGDKKYLMGEKPCEVDCTLFGTLCQILYNVVEKPEPAWLEDDSVKNLKEYTLRMKEEFWPDWDDCLDPKLKEDS